MVSAEGIDYKTRHDYLLSSLRKKEKDIEELEEKCLSFENRVLSLEQENDSLRLALQIIVQEKNEYYVTAVHKRQMIAGPLRKTPIRRKA